MKTKERLLPEAEPLPGKILAYRSLHGSASSDHLDMVRGAAALAVMLTHLRFLFFVDLADAHNSNPLVKLVYFVSGFGHYAVMAFFVLSGFLVGGSVLRGRMDGEFNWGLYATNRLTRLWIVLIPALLLGAIWDHLGLHLFGTSGVYGRLPGVTSLAPRLSASVMLGNMFFLQGITTVTYGSNGPLWSLSYEFWYYVLFPLMVLAYPVGKVGRSTVLYSLAALMVIFFVGETISLYFLIWLLGAAMNLAPERPGSPGRLWVLIAIGAVVIAVAVLKFKPGDMEYTDCFFGIASAIVIFFLLRVPSRSRSGLYSRAARKLAGFSYTLYLVHGSALAFVSAWLIPGKRWQPDAAHVAIVAGLGICTLAYAFVIARFTEDQTGAVRSRVTAALSLD